LSNVSNLSVGSPIVLDQVDNQKDNGGLYVGCEIADGSSACYPGASPNGYERGESSLSTIRGQQQIVNVTSISGNTVGITPGIYAANYNSAQSPGAWWASDPIHGDAVENISLDHTNGGDGITFFNCTGCWVQGVRSVTTSSGGTGWYHVGFAICNHCTVRNSYAYGYTGDDYGFTNEVGSDNRWENNIVQLPAESFFTNSDCEGCVANYDFSVNPYFGNSSNWLSPPVYYHGTVLYSLQEGNIGAGVYEDSFHGSHALNTQFRNRFDGHEQNDGNQTSSSTVAIRLNPAARYNNAIGNVLGTPGYHTTYKAGSNASGNTVYLSVISAGAYPEGGTSDSLVNSTALFWGNYDTVSGAARWCGNSSDASWSSTCGSASEVPASLSAYANPVPASKTLPQSFVYSSKPAWWPSGKAWPPIGPDVTGGNVGQCSGGASDSSEATAASQCSGGSFAALGVVNSIPAMDCYLNVMHGPANGTGNALSFDASACYSSTSSGGSGPAAPSNLSGVVQ
jgi:hypothetical protein